MPTILEDKDFAALKSSLPSIMRESLRNDENVLMRAFPLLNKVCPHREIIDTLRDKLKINLPIRQSDNDFLALITTSCNKLQTSFNHNPLFKYRLPVVVSEFPLHAREINNATKTFNHAIEKYYSQALPTLPDNLNQAYQNILEEVRNHGPQCDSFSISQLICMLSGWSSLSMIDLYGADNTINPIVDETECKQEQVTANEKRLFKRYAKERKKSNDEEIELSSVHTGLTAQERHQTIQPELTPVEVRNSVIPNRPIPNKLFSANYNHSIGGNGQQSKYGTYLSNHAFGMKLGGHFDAQVRYLPQVFSMSQLYEFLRRQLVHHIKLPIADSEASFAFNLWIESSLVSLGLEYIKNANNPEDLLVFPYLGEPTITLNPDKIYQHLMSLMPNSELNLLEFEIKLIGKYLYSFLQGFINPGQALGIGANWDGTINLSNESSVYAFKFSATAEEVAKRFKQLSLHRQGPSEVRMNAGKGAKYELGALLTSFDYMTQLQIKEYKMVIYNALIDNLVTNLFPEPPYFENKAYSKYEKHYVLHKTQNLKIESYFEPNPHGTYFKDKHGKFKQTPMHRRAGTLDVQPFPKDTGYSEDSRASYAGHHLAGLQMQHAQSMLESVRGDIVYDPIGKDTFLTNPFYGQVILSDNGDYLPFIGVVPKNFDNHFNQDTELCASFVMRMLQSASIIENCPTFQETINKIQTRFLPIRQSHLPVLPNGMSPHIIDKYANLSAALSSAERDFGACQKLFFSLLKNLLHSLYAYGKRDSHFKNYYTQWIVDLGRIQTVNKMTCERLMREIKTNSPVTLDEIQAKQFQDTLQFMQNLIQFFYPEPTDNLAKEVAYQAKLHVSVLAKNKSVNEYFSALKQSKQANLSRCLTPGMAFAALTHGGPSTAIVKEYGRMHNENFLSGYRDPEGNQMGEPQRYERGLDLVSKSLGASLQLMHRYDLFAVVRRPFVEAYVQSENMALQHPENKILWAVLGALKGFFWDGLAEGLWKTITTPFRMLADLIGWIVESFQKPKPQLENPLAISAAPGNEPGLKVKACMDTRDLILRLSAIDVSLDLRKSRKELLNHLSSVIKALYAHLTQAEIKLCYDHLNNAFPLQSDEWQDLLEPFESVIDVLSDSLVSRNVNNVVNDNPLEEYLLPRSVNPELIKSFSMLLKKYGYKVNSALVDAVFKCFIDPSCSKHPKKTIKKHRSCPTQTDDLLIFVKYFNRINDAEYKREFVDLFIFNGSLHQALKDRDQLMHKLHSWYVKVFDEQWLLEILFADRMPYLMQQLSSVSLLATLQQVPHCFKEPLLRLLECCDHRVLDDYDLDSKQKEFLLTINKLYWAEKDSQIKSKILQACVIEKKINVAALSVKDKNYYQWRRFYEREMQHQLLHESDVKQIFLVLRDGVKKNIALLNELDELAHYYQSKNFNRFYFLADQLYGVLPSLEIDSEIIILLKNFVDVTMNAVVNSMLDKIDIFADDLSKNPLLDSEFIKHWLQHVRVQQSDLRGLLEQQIHQSPSLDHALWRSKCILQVLEIPEPLSRVSKTGMQSLVRFWMQHRENVNQFGDAYYDPGSNQLKKVKYSQRLFAGSVTMEYAYQRVKHKVHGCSRT